MNTDILYKQLQSSITELKISIERFEKHTPPSTMYVEQLHHAITTCNKFISAYVVLKEQKDISPDLNLHLKLMNVEASKITIKEEVKPEPIVALPVIELPMVVAEPVIIIEEMKNESKLESVEEKKPVEIIFEKPELKTYPKLSININDKFRFINELFAGNTNEYNIAIEQLNNVNNNEEVIAYIKGLKQIYDWKDDSELYKTLNILASKRFV